jgi:hypothetical protein
VICGLLIFFNSLHFTELTAQFAPEVSKEIQEKFSYYLRVEDQSEFLKKVRASSDNFEKTHPGRISNTDLKVDSRGSEYTVSTLEETESEIHAAIHPNDSNQIVIGVIKQNAGSFQEPLTTPIYYTRDFGTSWETSEFNGYTEDFNLIAGGGDPVLVYDSDGTIHYTWLVIDVNPGTFSGKMGIYYASSENGGENWSYHGAVDTSTSFNLTTFEGLDKFLDKQWMAVDQESDTYKNNVYLAFTELAFDSLSVNANIVCRTKSPNDSVFGEDVSITKDSFSFAQFSSLDVDQGGNVHLTFVGSKDSIRYYLYHSLSVNGGQSFSTPKEISPVVIPGLTTEQDSYQVAGISPDRLYPCPHVKVDKGENSIHKDRIYVFWTAAGIQNTDVRGLDVYYSYSDDQGLNWSNPIILSQEGGANVHQFYSSINITHEGRIVATYYDRAAAAEDSTLTHYVMRHSTDGGENWSTPLILTGEASDFSQIGEKNGGFGVGEYNQTLVTDYQAIPIWADGRSNDGNINIYAALAPYAPKDSTSATQWQNLPRNWEVHSIFPNPIVRNGQIRLEVTSDLSQELSVTISDQHGRILPYSEKFTVYPQQRIQHLIKAPAHEGVYYLILKGKEGSYIKKIIVQ